MIKEKTKSKIEELTEKLKELKDNRYKLYVTLQKDLSNKNLNKNYVLNEYNISVRIIDKELNIIRRQIYNIEPERLKNEYQK